MDTLENTARYVAIGIIQRLECEPHAEPIIARFLGLMPGDGAEVGRALIPAMRESLARIRAARGACPGCGEPLEFCACERPEVG